MHKTILIKIFLPLACFLIVVNLLVTNTYLQFSKDKYESHESISFDYDYVSERIIGYLNYKYDDLNINTSLESEQPAFTETEITHMKDVKNLFSYFRIATLGMIIVVLGNFIFLALQDKKYIFLALKKIWITPVVVIAFFGIMALVSFDKLFTQFHKMFFTNDDWQLGSNDTLIKMLPQNFWLNSMLIILLGGTLLIASLMLFNRYYIKRKLKIR